jgi:hypothetical protein
MKRRTERGSRNSGVAPTRFGALTKRALAAAALAGLCQSTASADTWTGTGADANWQTDAN